MEEVGLPHYHGLGSIPFPYILEANNGPSGIYRCIVIPFPLLINTGDGRLTSTLDRYFWGDSSTGPILYDWPKALICCLNLAFLFNSASWSSCWWIKYVYFCLVYGFTLISGGKSNIWRLFEGDSLGERVLEELGKRRLRRLVKRVGEFIYWAGLKKMVSFSLEGSKVRNLRLSFVSVAALPFLTILANYWFFPFSPFPLLILF